MKLSAIKTPDLHAFAKACGLKNLKSAGRTREIIVSEIIEAKGWQSHDEATIVFLMNGGTIEQCRPQTNDKTPIGNQASAGKTKRKGQTEFDKRAKRFVAAANVAFYKLTNKDQNSFVEYLGANGINWGDDNIQIWGDGGLCDYATKWGLKVKVGETVDEPTKEKVKKVKAEKVERQPISKDGLVSLSHLCELYGVDGKVARRKLRTKITKPEAGWHFEPKEVDHIISIITK